MTTASPARRIVRPILYLLLILTAIVYLLPVYVLLVTALKSFAEVDLQTMWNLPSGFYFDNFREAFRLLAPHLRNSMVMVVSASLISSMVGSINGYIFAKWKFKRADLIFTLILFGMFIPYQSILIPLVQFMQLIGLRGTIAGLVLVHVIYGIPITTLIFRNYYAGVPTEISGSGAHRRGRAGRPVSAHPVPAVHPRLRGRVDLAVHPGLQRLPLRRGAHQPGRSGRSRWPSTTWQAARSCSGTCRWRALSWPPSPRCLSTSSWGASSCAA